MSTMRATPSPEWLAAPVGQLLSPKLVKWSEHSFYYYCLGCKMLHPVHVSKPPGQISAVWLWNWDFVKPTLSPSLNVTYSSPKGLRPTRNCHVFIREGKIQYLGDCYHDLKNTTIELPDIPADELD